MLQAGERAPTAGTSSGSASLINMAATANAVENRPIYRFDDIEVDASRGCLKRAGKEQHLRPQSFHLLLYLLERRETLVSKEELIENFWQGAAVTDNTVVQCIKEIRRALDDHPREPRFIKTFHKIGYRFIAAVTEEPVPALESHSIGEANGTHLPSTEANGAPRNAAYRISNSRFKRTLLAAAAVAVIVIAVWTLLSRPAAARLDVTLPQVPGRKALAVMYFENQSTRSDLNWLSEGLADMFIADLAHLDRLTVLSRQQLHLLLERSGLKPAKGIQLDQALGIARKSHADAVLLGSFGTLGEKILINVRLFDTASSQLLAADQFMVDQPADVLTQVDLVSPKLAAHLGAAPAGKQASLAEVMTKNLEAYRYYSLGVSKAQAFQNAQATALLRKAIQLDPTFAMAYARIGYAYSVTDFLPEKGKPFLEKAIQLSGHLPEKDRLYVSAWYAISRQDYPSAIRTLQQIVDQYPFESEAYTRLGRLLHREERPQETIAVVQRGLTVDPEYGDLYNVLGSCFLALARYDEAIAAHQHYVQLAPNEPNAHDSLGMSFQQSGRFERAFAEYNIALSLDPEFEPAIIHLGDVYLQQGRYGEAVHQYQRYIQVTGSDTARAIGYGSIAQVYLRRRDFSKAEQAVQNETRYERGAVWNSLLLALEQGQPAQAARLKERLKETQYPTRGSRPELRSYDYFLGTLALREKQPDQAIAHFRQALRHLPPSSGIDLYEDCLANACLKLALWDDAINEYQRILRLNPNYPLAQYHLAQAYQRKGLAREARIAYERFLEIWKSADAHIPEVVDAKQALITISSVARMAQGNVVRK
jgi:tetratricopeptide (TPR) repeat protein